MKKTDWIIVFLASIYILFLPLAPSSKFEYLLVVIFLSIGLIYLIELICSEEKRKDFFIRLKPIFFSGFTVIFMLLILVMLGSTIYSEDKIMSLKQSSRFIFYAGIYFIIRFRFDNEKIIETIIKVYMSSVAFVGLIGLKEFISKFKVGQDIHDILVESRVSATLGHPNAYGVYLILAIFPAIIMFVRAKGKNKIKFLFLLVLISVNIAATFSRNAWLALAIGILLLMVMYSWKYIFVYIVPAIFILFNPSILGRITQLLDSDINEGRVRLWKMSEKIISDHVIFGVGSGSFMTVYKKYAVNFPEFQIAEAEVLPPHNTYIKMFVEMGIVGAMVFLLFCLSIVKQVYKIKDKCNGIVKDFYDGYIISVICFFIMNCFDDMFFAPKVTGGFIVFVSIAYTIDTLKKKKEAI
jgi:O-antigen ligase